MNKGLEALESIKENCDLFDAGYSWDKDFSKVFDENIDNIEKELKRLEELEIMYSNCVIEGAKQKKALDIIKKHIKINAYRIFADGFECELAQEEHDLLKEVLE